MKDIVKSIYETEKSKERMRDLKRILCAGSVTADVIVTPADSIPTPGTLRAVEGVSTHVGGCAANAAIDLAKLGVPVTLSCKVGRDSFGRFVRETAAAAGVDVKGVVEDAGVETTVSIVCVNSSGERSFLYNPGSAAAYTAGDIDPRLVEESDMVFVAGGMLPSPLDGGPRAPFLENARAQGKFTAMDTAWDFDDVWLPKVAAALPHLDLFMPSLEEAQKLTGETEPDRIADRFFERGVANVIIKLGKEGALFCPAGQERFRLATYRSVQPVDTTGAGDSFCAGFLAGLAQGWDFRSSGAFANAVGTHCIMAVGASTGIRSIPEIREFMAHNTVG